MGGQIERFAKLKPYWETVKIGFLRELPMEVRIEIEDIYRKEFNAEWLPNRFCKKCYFDAIKELVNHFGL